MSLFNHRSASRKDKLDNLWDEFSGLMDRMMDAAFGEKESEESTGNVIRIRLTKVHMWDLFRGKALNFKTHNTSIRLEREI